MSVEFIHTFHQLDFGLVSKAVAFSNRSDLTYITVFMLAEVLIFLFPVVLYILWRSRERKVKHGPQKAVVIAVMSIVFAFAIKAVLGFIYFRARPFISHPELLSMPLQATGDSFPSGHTMLAFATAASLNLSGYRKLGVFLYICAILVAVARVFAGVHYPSDIIGGAILGMLTAWYLHRNSSTLKRFLPNS